MLTNFYTLHWHLTVELYCDECVTQQKMLAYDPELNLLPEFKAGDETGVAANALSGSCTTEVNAINRTIA